MSAQAIRDAETLRRLATGWRLRLVDATALLPIADRIEQMGADLDEQRGLADSRNEILARLAADGAHTDRAL